MGHRFQSVSLRAMALAGALLLLPPFAHADAPAIPLPTTAVLASPYTIQRLAFDPWEGGVWIGTEGGLFFKDLSTGALRHYGIGDGLPHFKVQDITLDSDRIWVATGWGVAVLDRASQQISLVEREDGTLLRVSSQALFSDADGVWIGSEGRGLFRVDRSTLVATPVPNPMNGTDFKHTIYGIGAVGDELYISAARYGLVRWDRASGQSWLYDDAYLQDEPYYGRIDASPKEVWIGSGGEGTLRLDRTTWKMDEYASFSTVNAHEVYRPVKAFGYVWFPTDNGVSRFDPATKTWRGWTEFPGGGNLNEVVLADGELYGATDRAFIVRYDRNIQEWQYVAWWADAQMMDHNLVQSCETTPQGTLLFGTGGGGVHLFEPRSGWSVYGGVPGQPQPADINIMAMHADGQAQFFTHYSGVSELNLANGSYLHYFADGRGVQDTRWGHNVVRDVEADGASAWFASRTTREKQLRPTDPIIWHPGKVTRVDRATHEMTYFGGKAGLSDGNLTTLALDGQTLWVGMERGGLDALDTASGVIRHVFPSSGNLTVNNILVDGGRLWLSTAQRGVLLLDPVTGQAQSVSGLGPAVPLSLHSAAGSIWVGTYYGGLFQVDPQSLQSVHYGVPGPLDRVIYCMADRDGLLYMGTAWGVERFDLQGKTFLSQVLPLSGANNQQAQGQQGRSLSITSPLPDAVFSADQTTIAVTGTASAPVGSMVEVRIADGDWVQADSVDAWSVSLDVQDAPSPARITVRLSSAGAILAQEFRYVSFGSATATTEESIRAPLYGHEPVLEAWVGEPWKLEVNGSNVPPDASLKVTLIPPGLGEATLVPLVNQGNGTFVADMPAFQAPGEASYRIDVASSSGRTRLPTAEQGYGDAFPVLVRDLVAGAKPLILEPQSPQAKAGTPSDLDIVVQNPSGRDQTLRVRLDAPAGVTGPTEIFLPGGGSAVLKLHFELPAAHPASWERIGVELLPLEGEAPLAEAAFDLAVADVSGALPPEPRDAPMPVWLGIAALALALARRRRL